MKSEKLLEQFLLHFLISIELAASHVSTENYSYLPLLPRLFETVGWKGPGLIGMPLLADGAGPAGLVLRGSMVLNDCEDNGLIMLPENKKPR